MEDREPTDDEMRAIVNAAHQAAKQKAIKLGLAELYGIAGLIYAGEVASKALDAIALIGPELAELLADAMDRREIEKMHEEAESTLE